MSDLVELDTDRLTGCSECLHKNSLVLMAVGRELASIGATTGLEAAIGEAASAASNLGVAALQAGSVARRIVADGNRADRFNTPGWWLLAAGSATTRALTAATGARERRDAFERLVTRFGPDVWQNISMADRKRLLESCPDLVADLVLSSGGSISARELELLNEAFRYDKTSDRYYAEADGRIRVEYVDIVVAGEFELIVVERSDGTVTITYCDGVDVGAGMSAQGGRSSASGDATVGANRSITFEFESKEQSDAAIDDLRRAAAGAAAELSRRPSGWEWVGIGVPAVALASGGNRVARALTADTVQETLDKWGDHIDRVEMGAEITREVTGSTSIPAFGDLSASAGNTLEVGYSDEAQGDDDYFSAKVRVNVSGSAAASLAAVANRTGFKLNGKAEASAEVEFRHGTNGHDRVILTLEGQATSELARGGEFGRSGPGQASQGTLEHIEADGVGASMTIEIPVNDTTKGAVNETLRSLASGDDISEPLLALYDETDITVVTSSVEAESHELSFGILDASAGHETETTTHAYRKWPGGDFRPVADLVDQLGD